jgi:hypothetical protein
MYDQWCGNGGRCHTVKDPGRYIGLTKLNMAHGYIDLNGQRKVGEFDIVINTNLSGRRPRWTVHLYWDNEPNLTFKNMYMHCREVKDWATDPVCGLHTVRSSSITLKPVSYKWNSSMIYGNYLRNSAAYYGQFEWDVYPAAKDAKWLTGMKETDRFKCFGTNNEDCRF